MDDTEDIDDVVITSIGDKDIIAYDSGTSKYINQTAAELGIPSSVRYIPPITLNGDQGWVQNNGRWSVSESDTDARMWARFICPETRDDWQVATCLSVDVIAVSRSFINVGSFANGEAPSYTNLINATIFDKTVYTTLTVSLSAAFTLTAGDIVWVLHAKRYNDGTDTVYHEGLYLYHA